MSYQTAPPAVLTRIQWPELRYQACYLATFLGSLHLGNLHNCDRKPSKVLGGASTLGMPQCVKHETYAGAAHC